MSHWLSGSTGLTPHANEDASRRNKIVGFIKITGESTFIFVPSSAAAPLYCCVRATKGTHSISLECQLSFRKILLKEKCYMYFCYRTKLPWLHFRSLGYLKKDNFLWARPVKIYFTRTFERNLWRYSFSVFFAKYPFNITDVANNFLSYYEQ